MSISVKYAIRNTKTQEIMKYDVYGHYSEEEGVLSEFSLCINGSEGDWYTNKLAYALITRNVASDIWTSSSLTPSMATSYRQETEIVSIYTLDDSLTVITTEGVPQTIEELTGSFEEALRLSSYEQIDKEYEYSEQQHKYLEYCLSKEAKLRGMGATKDSVLDYFRICEVMEQEGRLPVFDPIPLFRDKIKELSQKYL